MSKIDEHPGYLGMTSEGVILIHANWPMYPAEHGWRVALASLGQFPAEETFYAIDDIDMCFLFLVGEPSNVKDPFDEELFHVAVWWSDVEELLRQGYVTSTSGLSMAAWEEQWVSGFDSWLSKDEKIELSPEEKRELEVEALGALVKKGLRLSSLGLSALRKLMATQKEGLHPELRLHAGEIVKIGRFDAAVREGCVLLESRLKDLTKPSLYGQRLVDEFIAGLDDAGRYVSADVKVLRSEIRTVFKFIRNDFMHNRRNVTEEQCWSILVRISSILRCLDSLVSEQVKHG
ncbi:TIGR02391 family protein [Hyalangium sp.]|uniref:TIGR02391 family protein n=1 Tax=Hyalangium sp. TaxID=2028555 RepID=UPI002D248EA9|nr:TIGR02391 family protein [Hyalangium sp.]HYI01122.1 TIGR02391 family protein [Hyalangium sp.]